MLLPPWANALYPYQLSAIQSTIEAFNSTIPLVMLDAPTGSGKTLIGEMIRQSMNVRGLYLCSSLSLQNQFKKDFPNAAILYGRSNYPTSDKPDQFPDLSTADCNKNKTSLPACGECDGENSTADELHCRWCHPVSNCPYERAKATGLRSSLLCTNSYYFLFEANYVGNTPAGRGLVVVDEADTIETILSSFVTVQISSRMAKEYGIEPPQRKTVESSWIEWAKSSQPSIESYYRSTKCSDRSLEGIRNKVRTERLLSNIQRLNNSETGLAAGGWVYTGYDKGDIQFKPIEVANLARDFLWRHCKKWLLMSATMISFQQMAESLGIEEYEVV